MPRMRLLLVDGHYYLYRSFFAIRGLTNSRGEATNAIFGFSKALRKMLADTQPDRAAVIWDSGLPERRTTLQPEYKKNRDEMPAEMRPQEVWLQRHVPRFGPASVMSPNTEADDIFAAYARAARADDAEVVIATNDKDIMQLVSDSVRIYSTAKTSARDGGFALLGPHEVSERWGVAPSRIGDVLALTGDASDNIPGVPGVGEKTAARLVREFGSIGDLIAGIDRVEPVSLREKLVLHAGRIMDNLRMVALDDDLPLPAPWTELSPRVDYDNLLRALRGCEFKGLVKEVEAEAGRVAAVRQGELF